MEEKKYQHTKMCWKSFDAKLCTSKAFHTVYFESSFFCIKNEIIYIRVVKPKLTRKESCTREFCSLLLLLMGHRLTSREAPLRCFALRHQAAHLHF